MKFLIIVCVMVFGLNASAEKFTEGISSPVTTKASPWFWSGVGITGALILTEDVFSDPASKQISNKRPLGDLSRLGDLSGQVYPNVFYVLGMSAHSYFADDEHSYNRAAHMAKATVYAGITATVLKYTVREPRPDNSQEKNSFPSGHTTTAFAFATVVASQHEWYWGVGAFSLASLTALSRVNDGRHFYHDVAGGITLGVGYGLGLKYVMKSEGKFAIAPIYTGDQKGLRIVHVF